MRTPPTSQGNGMLHGSSQEEWNANKGESIYELRKLLKSKDKSADALWKRWAQALLDNGKIDQPLLFGIWREVLDFDPTLSRFVRDPISTPFPAVLVAGSGKETFKTFNVSTAASILAAAAGTYVVKGVSRSVSAVSGSADVLDILGLPICDQAARIPKTLEIDRIAFVSYSAFCPTYAGRYDGVFHRLSPFSFFMPVSVLGVRAVGFVYGLSHTDVSLSCEAITSMRPDLSHGLVVSTEISNSEVMDERTSYGVSYTSDLNKGCVSTSRKQGPTPSRLWRSVIAHRSRHKENAELLRLSLSPTGPKACTELVEQNAALIVSVANNGTISESSAFAHVREVRLSGEVMSFLTRLQERTG